MPRPRTGSVARHGDHYDYRITLPDGSRSNSVCMPGKTRAEVRDIARADTEWAAKNGATRAPGASPKGPTATIADVVDRWVPLITASDLAPGTRSNHLQNARAIKERFGKEAPADVTTGTLRAWLRDMKTQHSSSRARSRFFSLSKMLDDAAAEDWITCPNPCRHAKVREEVPPVLTPEDEDKAHHTEIEASTLIRATTAPERRLRYLVAYTSGMRDGEIAGLRWMDLSEEKGVLVYRIRGAVAREGDKGWATRRPTKTPAGRRMIPVHPLAAAALKAWKATGWAAYVGREPKDEHPIFPDANGGECRPKSAPLLRADLEAAGLPTKFGDEPFEFRSTRRSFSTWLEARDVSGDAIDRLLGHASVSVRRRHYSAANLETLARAIAIITLDLGKDDGGEASNESSDSGRNGDSTVFVSADPSLETSQFAAENDERLPNLGSLKTGAGASLASASEPRITPTCGVSPPRNVGGSDDSLDETPRSEGLLAVLGRAIHVAALEGRSDVAGELAALVGRLAGEERARANAAAGVASLGVERVRRDRR